MLIGNTNRLTNATKLVYKFVNCTSILFVAMTLAFNCTESNNIASTRQNLNGGVITPSGSSVRSEIVKHTHLGWNI
jgi:hypothetical protein